MTVCETAKLMLKWTRVICLICTVLFEPSRESLSVVVPDGELYTQFATQCLRIYLSLILFTCVQGIARSLQSIGHARTTSAIYRFARRASDCVLPDSAAELELTGICTRARSAADHNHGPCHDAFHGHLLERTVPTPCRKGRDNRLRAGII